MTAEPIRDDWQPDTGSYEVIHLGQQAAVVVPLADFLRLRTLEHRASVRDLEDAEDLAAVLDVQARKRAGTARSLPLAEVRRRLHLDS